MKKYLLALMLLLILSPWRRGAAQGNDTLRLSLEEARVQLVSDNYDLRESYWEMTAAERSYRAAANVYAPRVNISSDLTLTTDPLQVLGIRLKKENITPEDFSPEFLNAPDAEDNLTVRLQVRQPIYTPAAADQRDALEARAQARTLQRNREQRGLLLQLRQKYFRLYTLQRSLEVLDSSIAVAQRRQGQLEDELDQGLRIKSEVQAAQLKVLELRQDRRDTRQQAEDAGRALAYLLGRSPDQVIQPTDSLEVDTDRIDRALSLEVSPQRSDLQALERMAVARARQAEAANHLRLPQINGLGYVETNDYFGAINYLAGINLQWNIFNGNSLKEREEAARAQEEAATVRREKTLSQSRLDLENAKGQLRLARDQLEIVNQSVRLSADRLRSLENREEQGLVLPSDVSEARVQLAENRLKALRLNYRIYVQLRQLEFLTERELN